MVTWMKRCGKILPLPVKRVAKIGYLYLSDIVDAALGRRDASTPPRYLAAKIRIGGGGYQTVGEKFFGHFVNLCSLKSDERC